MRPIKLTMTDIGPFPGIVELDFEALGEVFLVCGPTGSGKTTLFDAMTWALYGSLPGTREPSDLASHFSDGERVGVRFEFSVGPSRWCVTRSPERLVARKRGEGSTSKPHEAALYRREGLAWKPVSDKVSEVEEAVTGLLGLSKDEFTKIVLLPQGQFQRFLEMDTRERAAILEKLFPVAEHAAVAEQARLRSREAESEAQRLDARIGELSLKLGDDPRAALEALNAGAELASERERGAMEAAVAAERAAEAAAALSRAWAELDQAEEAESGLPAAEAEAASMQARVGRAEAAAAIRAELEDGQRLAEAERLARVASDAAAAALARSEAGRAETEALGSAAEALSAELEDLDRRSGDLNARKGAWDRLASARAALAEAERGEAEAKARLDGAEAAERETLAALSAAREGAPDPEALSAEREALRSALSAAEETHRRALAAERLRAESGSAESSLASALQRLADAERRRRGSLEALEAAEAKLDADAAARLANRLEDGAPCPVCGSPSHPRPAGSVAAEGGQPGAGSQALETLRAAAIAAGEAHAGAAAAVAALRSEIERRTGELASLGEVPALKTAAADLARLAELERRGSELARAEAGRARQIAEIETRRDAARAEADAARKALAATGMAAASARAALGEALMHSGEEDPAGALDAIRKRRLTAAAELSGARARIDTWTRENGLAVSRAADASARLKAAEETAVSARRRAEAALAARGFADADAWSAASLTEAELSALRAGLDRLSGGMVSVRTRAEAARKAVQGLSRPDGVRTEAGLAAAREALAEAKAESAQAAAEAREFAASLSSLETALADRQALRVRGDRLRAMSTLLNGEISGRRLSFRNWALGAYFQRVAERASARLREMSDGRYDLAVSEGRSRGRGGIGLELEVLDAYTGRSRPASSLSGGEKFLTSISLALGLSDVIVRRAGGVSLDSIFIDEGFGSLDGDSLDRAMAALDRIRGDRTIGIVSHVDELKTRLPSRVEVIKTSSGSRLEIR